MNQTVKNLIRIGGAIAGLGAAIWAMSDRLLPSPEIHDEPPPLFRIPQQPDDLTEIKGIGPVKAGKLNDAGINTFADVASMPPDELAGVAETSVATATRWSEDARARS
ncbi:MAG: helix-hairpin-helix domain-containing protein [Actinomycetota bacterium]